MFMYIPGLDFQRKILGPAGLYVFIFGWQDKYFIHQKLSSRKNRIQYTKGLLINLNKIISKLQKVNPEYKRRPTKQAT